MVRMLKFYRVLLERSVVVLQTHRGPQRIGVISVKGTVEDVGKTTRPLIE